MEHFEKFVLHATKDLLSERVALPLVRTALPLILTSIVVVAVSRIATCGACARSHRKRGKDDEAEVVTRSHIEQPQNGESPLIPEEFACTICDRALPQPENDNDAEPVARKHCAGKKHLAAVVTQGGVDPRTACCVWRAVKPPVQPVLPVPVAASVSAAMAAAAAATAAAAAAAAADGHRSIDNDDDAGGGAWQRVKGTPQGPTSSGGGGGGGHVALASFRCLIGSTNLLEGLTVVESFLTEKEKLHSWVETAIREAQQGRMRRDTWTPSRRGVAGHLNYGCYFDAATGAPSATDLKVEPLPPILVELSKRIVTKAPLLGGPAVSSFDCATVWVIEPGMHVPPVVASATHFKRPIVLVVQAGTPVLTFGLSMEEADEGKGQYIGSFDLPLRRRSLVALSGTAASTTEHAVSASPARAVLIELRSMRPDFSALMQAKGNAN